MTVATLPARPSPASATTDADLALLRSYGESNDSQAFSQLVQRYVHAVYATSLRIVGDPARAEDISQETFFRLMRRPHDVTQNVGAWLHRTATHLALDAIRSDTARRKREIVYTRECTREASTWAELSPAVDQALSELPEELRDLLVQHFLVGRTQADLAHDANVSPATISRRVQDGLEELRRHLRLKGVYALPAALGALLANVSTRHAPASLLRELGKMAMCSGLHHSAHARFATMDQELPTRRILARFAQPRMILTMVATICAGIFLQVLVDNGTFGSNRHAAPVIEPPPPAVHKSNSLLVMKDLAGVEIHPIVAQALDQER